MSSGKQPEKGAEGGNGGGGGGGGETVLIAPNDYQNIYSVSKAKEKAIAESTKLVNIKEDNGKDVPQDGKKDSGKSCKKGPCSPSFSGRKQRPPKSGGGDGKDSNKDNSINRRSNSRKKGSRSKKNRRSSSKHKKHRSHSKGRSHGHHHRHRGHSHSKKKLSGKCCGSPEGKGKDSPRPKTPLPPPGGGKEPGLGDQKTPIKEKSSSGKPPKQQSPEDGGTMLIAPADYKVYFFKYIFIKSNHN
ncbi:hypothetical protein TYRP_019047 [Tyrophagus putrescentiae]|nr:hypothetical protein TYRP_019047 [Tyrophagus putrescentiae]